MLPTLFSLTERPFFLIITTDQSVTFLQREKHALYKGSFGQGMRCDSALLSSIKAVPGAGIVLGRVQAKRAGSYGG